MIIAGYSLLQIFVLIIVIAAVCAIVHVALRKMGVAIPDWAVQMFWIVVVAVVALFAVYLLFSLIGRL